MKRIWKCIFIYKISDGMWSNENICELKKIKKYNILEIISFLIMFELFSVMYYKLVIVLYWNY